MTKFDMYKLAIDARDKLNENYHKWMTFYYVANGAILVALITIMTRKPELIEAISILAIVGVLISIFWNLSCKGYYYWSKNWIEIIIRHEKELIESSDDIDLGVYSIFSKNIHDSKNSIFKIYGHANISTPKLTLIFSFSVILLWTAFSLYTFFEFYENIDLICKVIISSLSILLLGAFYGLLLPKLAKSKIGEEKLHDLK